MKTRLEILLGLLCLITTPKVSIVWLFMLALKRKLHFRKHLYFKQFNYLIWINVQNQVFRSRKLDPRFLCFFQRKKSLSMTKSVSFFQLFFFADYLFKFQQPLLPIGKSQMAISVENAAQLSSEMALELYQKECLCYSFFQSHQRSYWNTF